MLSLQNISKQYGERHLFSGLNLHIGDRERIAVVGSNGSGKSTLMKIMVGEVEPDDGRLSLSRAQSIAYLPQDGIYHSGRTLHREIESALGDLLILQRRIGEIGSKIAQSSSGSELQALTDELGELQHQLEYRQGYDVESRIGQIASGLGFSEHDLERPTHEFSGGWQMRIELAKLLLRKPNFLLLDEPTNHLDINSLEWLESFLQNYDGTIIVVSHDRRFLDNLVRRTIEISMGKIFEYRGNYSAYLEKKAERQELLQAQYESQQKTIEKTTRFIERFRYKATKARQVQSRLRMLEKMERVAPEETEGGIYFDFPQPPHSGRVLLELEGVTKAYGPEPVFRDVTLRIERGDRIAVLGANGTGKSTLARIVAGREGFQSGTRKPGRDVVIGYYAQDQAEVLDPKKTVLQTVEEVATGESATRLRSLLGCFLFEQDDVFKPVSVLSGGEKSRLALARLLLIPSHLLILDEPTNHLDIRSKAILQDALVNYAGAFLIVSHDRDFLQPLIDKVLDFKDGQLRLTLGSVDEVLGKWHEEQETGAIYSSQQPGRGSGQGTVEGEAEKRAANGKERKREEAQQRQTLYRKLKPLRDELEKVESGITSAEQRKSELETLLADPETYKNEQKGRALSAEYKNIKIRLDGLYDRWTTLHEEIEKIPRPT